jgi:hypothetical protein
MCKSLSLLGVLAVLSCPLPSWAQSSTGSIRGVITDPSKGAVPGARVTVTDVDRNVEYTTVADSEGRYIFPTLPAARYTLVVEAAGFKKATQSAFKLEVQQQATVNVDLVVGAVTTEVEVSATAPLLNTTSPTLGQVVENKFLMAAPNQARNPLSMVLLAPGVTGAIGGVAFVSNGVRNNASEVMMDGGALTGIEQNGGITDVKYLPTTDVIEEFKIQTNYFSAEYGNTGGTVINMVSKSGTNQIHGVGYYFRRDNGLNANNWFSNRNGSPLVDGKRDNFGGTLGGPVVIPGVYNGKNRTFFFFDYDHFKNLGATTLTATVPTAQQLTGDFSDTRLANGNLSIVYNPYSLTTNSAGVRVRNPFAGNIVPSSMQNPITLRFIKYYPAPTSSGNAFTHVNNFFAQGVNETIDSKIDIKIDHNISAKSRLTARYGIDFGASNPANLLGNIAHNANPGINRNQNFIIDYTRTQNATTIFAGRVGALRVKSLRDPLSSGFDQTSLGLPKIIQTAGVLAFPRFTPGAPYTAIGAGGFAIIHRYEDVYQALGSVTKIIRGHTFKTGAEFRKLHENYFQPNLPNGGFTFSRNQTALNPIVSSSSQGDGLASALLGWGTGGSVTIDYPTCQSSGYFGTFINDEWRMSRKLTLSLGVRYDFDIPRTDRFDRLNWFDPTAPSPIRDQVKAYYPNLNGVMKFVDGDTRSPFDGDYNNVQPRVGLAYAFDAKTSLRAAYGLFYTTSRHTIKGEVGSAFGLIDTGIQWSRDRNFTQYATFSNPWPDGLILPPGRDPLAFLGLDAGANFRRDDNPQYQMWNLSIQREVPGSAVVEVNYVGTKGTHLYFGTGDILSDLNILPSVYWKIGQDALSEQVTNPFYGVIKDAKSILSSPTVTLDRLLRPFPQYSGSVGGYRASPNNGNSMYHAATFKYEKRFSRGLSVIAHYTISKMISDSDVSGSDIDFIAGGSSLQNLDNLRQERSLSVFDVPQRFVLSFDYHLPFGRNRAIGTNMNRILDGVIGGWELSSIITAQSRTPLAITQAENNLWQGDQRPNLVGDPSMPGSPHDKLNSYFNAKAFQEVGPDQLGSTARTLANYRGPGINSWDATLAKNFNMAEKKYLQLRLEAYSVLNHPIFGNPNTSFGSSNFGQITSASGARALQVAAKFYF